MFQSIGRFTSRAAPLAAAAVFAAGSLSPATSQQDDDNQCGTDFAPGGRGLIAALRPPPVALCDVKKSVTSKSQENYKGLEVNHGSLKIFSGNAHPKLAASIAEHIGVPISDVTANRFKCGEIDIQINESVRDCDVFVIQPTCNEGANNGSPGGPNEHLMELLLILDAARRGGAGRVTAVIPVFGYARQDKKDKSRAPISAKLVSDMIQLAGADRVLTVDLHASQIQGFASYPIDNMYALPLLAARIEELMAAHRLSVDDVVIVSPDAGGAKRALTLANNLGAALAIFSKQRKKANEVSQMILVGDVEGKTCVLIDDMADTAGTLCEAARQLKEHGARSTLAAVIHGYLSDPACDRINKSPIERLIVADTIPLDDKVARCPKLDVVSVAPLLAAAIENVHTGKSLSMFFDQAPEIGEDGLLADTEHPDLRRRKSGAGA